MSPAERSKIRKKVCDLGVGCVNCPFNVIVPCSQIDNGGFSDKSFMDMAMTMLEKRYEKVFNALCKKDIDEIDGLLITVIE